MTIQKTLTNQKGLLTLDFIFATLLVFGFSTIIFSFGITLSVVEVVQYITFSTARNYSLAHYDENKQKERAQLKFDELTSHPAIIPLIDSGWFETGTLQISDFNSEYSPDSSFGADNFVGARVEFSAPILYKRIPLIGTTGTDPDGFKANIQSFLAREPTFKECQSFTSERINRIGNLNGLYRNVMQPSKVAAIMDNGC